MLGKMLWFNEVKNFGFIQTEEGERLYVHRSAFLSGHAPVGRCAGVAVAFGVSGGEGGRTAVDVSVVAEADHGRARPRRSGTRLFLS